MNEKKQIVAADDSALGQIADRMIASSMVPRGLNRGDVMVCVAYAERLGIHWTQAFSSIAIINSRPSIWGRALLGLCRSSGVFEDIEESYDSGDGKDPDKAKAVCIVTRKGEKPKRYEFSIADAKRAGLWDKSIWRQYPKRMLQMRARGYALTDTYADVLCGLCVAEELIEAGVGVTIEHNAELERQIVENAGKELPPAMIDGEPIDVDKIGQQWTPEDIAAIDKGGDTKLF